jgi:hypothetical protein
VPKERSRIINPTDDKVNNPKVINTNKNNDKSDKDSFEEIKNYFKRR